MLRNRPEHTNDLEFRVIGDMAIPGIFDDEAQGVDAIIHIASVSLAGWYLSRRYESAYSWCFPQPVVVDGEENERVVLIPTIEGTKSVFSAAKKHSTVKRVVLTSSIAAIFDPDRLNDGSLTLTSKDWCSITYQEAKEGGQTFDAYRGAKKFAELAAWEFIQKEAPHFDLVTLCPSVCFGPVVHPVSEPSGLNISSHTLWEVVSGADPLPYFGLTAFVDVRDVALAHVEAVLRPEVGGQRFIINSPERFSYQLLADMLRKEFAWAREEVTKGNEGEPVPEQAELDGETGANALGLHYRGLKSCILETATQLREMYRT
ncbi:hypothetical protein NLI96_g8613 [Meripilus lineatus]|uniref:Uncharacterized protein n=1 Tax=Meripilus lineatus TaxID=2056292 RepID=A0AAD5YAZ6_9APHY|nr:hypothetical protein NLI96_g8613 [Physisporinus lineatus]